METSKGYTMIEFENNAYFWQKLDTLYLSSGYQITRKKGEVHPRFQNLIYPVDYGYINDTKSFGKDGVSVYAGSGNRYEISALVVAADILIKELDVKVLVGCTDEEVDQLLYKKWFGSVIEKVEELVQSPIKAEIAVLEELNKRYSETLDSLDGEIAKLEKELEALMNELVVL